MSVAHTRSAEAAETEIARFIERRAEQRERDGAEDEGPEGWQTMTTRHAQTIREAARVEWAARHQHLARLHDRLAREHEQEAVRLLETES